MFMNVWLGARATLFWVGFAGSTVFFGLLVPLLMLFPYRIAYPTLVNWHRFNLWWLKTTCGVHYQIKGKENIPVGQAAVVMSNHQSTWETLALATIFPPMTWVLKRELLNIPFFGWGLRLIKPVAIDRSAGRSAIEQVKTLGQERLAQGIGIVVFPEGTRVKPGVKARYRIGGAVMAAGSGYPVIPVAHNAGESWPRHAYIKRPGTVTVSIGKPIGTAGKTPEALMAEVEAWIEAEKAGLVFP